MLNLYELDHRDPVAFIDADGIVRTRAGERVATASDLPASILFADVPGVLHLNIGISIAPMSKASVRTGPPRSATPGEHLYVRWCGDNGQSDRSSYYPRMNRADKMLWERLAALHRADVAAAGRRTNAIELLLPIAAGTPALLVRPTDRVKHVARMVARLMRAEASEMQRWTLESLGVGWESAADAEIVGERLERELTVLEAGLVDGCVVLPRPA